jgi:hypothetical protein
VELPYQTALNLIKDLKLAGHDPDHPDNPDLMQTTWDVINLRCKMGLVGYCVFNLRIGLNTRLQMLFMPEFVLVNRCVIRLCSLRTTLSLQVRPDTITVAAVLLAMKLHNMPAKLISGKHWMLHEKCHADPKQVEGL